MFSGSHIFLTLSENPRPGIVSLSHRRTSAAQVPLTLQKTDSGRRLDKLSAQDPKVNTFLESAKSILYFELESLNYFNLYE